MDSAQNPQLVSSNSYNPIHFFWYFKYLAVFILILLFSARNISTESLFNVTLTLGLVILFWLIGKRFKLLFKGEDLFVYNLFKKPTSISANSIKKVLVRQGIIGKILGINSLYVQFQFSDIKKMDQYPFKQFGLPIKDMAGLQFPGVWGDLICIPDISKKNTDRIIEDLGNLTKGNIAIENIGFSYPWYKTLSKMYYILSISLLILLLITAVIISFWLSKA